MAYFQVLFQHFLERLRKPWKPAGINDVLVMIGTMHLLNISQECYHLSQLAWQDNIEVDLKKDLDWIELVECKVQWQDFVNPVMNLQVTWMQGISWPGKHLRTFKDPASCNWIAFTKLTGEFNPLTLISTKSLPWIILNDIPLYENFYLLH